VLSEQPPTLPELLAAHGLAERDRRPFEHDGWSGSLLERFQGPGADAFVLKRTSWSRDWIVRATNDQGLREARLAASRPVFAPGVVAPYLGVAQDGDGAALLMPDLSGSLIGWDGPDARPISADQLDHVLGALAALHATPWWPAGPSSLSCPVDRRISLLTRPAAEGLQRDGLAFADRFVAGWDAFDRRAPRAARDLVTRLSADPSPLLDTLARLPQAGLHGDMKLANVAPLPTGEVALIDWQMTLLGPVSIELGWLLVSNVALLPLDPDGVAERYRRAAVAAGGDLGDWPAQLDTAWIVGLLLRGWRKGLDADAAVPTGWGATGEADLAWWCARAIEAAERRL
jgi:hypothetical protein